VVFDGILAFAGDDDDVLDAGGDALFDDILNLWLVDHSEHFFRLRFRSGEKASAESGGREDGFADFVAAARGAAGLRRVGEAEAWLVIGSVFAHSRRIDTIL